MVSVIEGDIRWTMLIRLLAAVGAHYVIHSKQMTPKGHRIDSYSELYPLSSM